MYSGESRVVLTAGKEEFGADGGFLGDRPTVPVSCTPRVAAAVAVGFGAATATGAALAAAAQHYGGHHDSGCESVTGGSAVAGGSVQSLIGARIDALSAA